MSTEQSQASPDMVKLVTVSTAWIVLKECLPTMGNSGHGRRSKELPLESEPKNVVPITDQQITEAQNKSFCSEHSHKSKLERGKEIARGVIPRTGIPSGTAKCPQEEASAIQSHYNV